MLRKETAFPRWRAMDRRWNKNAVIIIIPAGLVRRFVLTMLQDTTLQDANKQLFVITESTACVNVNCRHSGGSIHEGDRSPPKKKGATKILRAIACVNSKWCPQEKGQFWGDIWSARKTNDRKRSVVKKYQTTGKAENLQSRLNCNIMQCNTNRNAQE